MPAGTTEEQWRLLRDCESKENYSAISSTGRYRGAYQFSRRTWNWLAENTFPELVGVDPAVASVADQDKMAYKLYERSGRGQWPVCGRVLP